MIRKLKAIHSLKLNAGASILDPSRSLTGTTLNFNGDGTRCFPALISIVARYMTWQACCPIYLMALRTDDGAARAHDRCSRCGWCCGNGVSTGIKSLHESNIEI